MAKRFLYWTVGVIALGVVTSAFGQGKPIDGLLGKCPTGQTYFDNHNECLPSGKITEVDGVSMEDIAAILDAHRDELHAIKGVMGVGMDQRGMFVDVWPEHDPLPERIEGLPLHTHPYVDTVDAHHTDATSIRPLAPGVLISNGFVPNLGVLGMPVLAHGELWALTTAHQVLWACQNDPPYPLPGLGKLYTIPRYAGAVSHFVQPEVPGTAYIGWPQTWSRLVPDTNPPGSSYRDIDAAAVAIDNDTTMGNYSMATWTVAAYPLPAQWEVRQDIEGSSGETYHSKVDGFSPPYAGEAVFIYTGDAENTGTHILAATITAINHDKWVNSDCQNGNIFQHWVKNQFDMTASPFAFRDGDSGSIVRDQGTWRFVGTFNWREWGNAVHGGGTDADTLWRTVGFDDVYGDNATQLRVGPFSPTSGYVQAGNTSCSYVPVKNVGNRTAGDVRLENLTITSPQPSFSWGSPTGWGVPYAVSPGQTVQFYFCMNSTVAKAPLNYLIRAYGVNALADVIKFEYNTFTAGWGSSPAPNISLSEVSGGNDDLVRIPTVNGAAGFFVGANNYGVAGTMMLDVHPDGQPVYTWACEYSLSTGQCLTTLLPTPWSTFIGANSSKTYLVWVAGLGQPVTLDPHYHRIYTTFHNGLDVNGPVVGSIGIAVEVAQ